MSYSFEAYLPSVLVEMKRKIDMVDILFWTPGGQLLRNKRIITVTNIAAEVVEYVLLPHNDDVTKHLC